MLKVQQMKANLENCNLNIIPDQFAPDSEIGNIVESLFESYKAHIDNDSLVFMLDEESRHIINPKELENNKSVQTFIKDLAYYRKLLENAPKSFNSINLKQVPISFVKIAFKNTRKSFFVQDAKSKQYVSFEHFIFDKLEINHSYGYNHYDNVNVKYKPFYWTGRFDSNGHGSESKKFLYYPDTKTVKSIQIIGYGNGLRKEYFSELPIIENLDFTDNLELLTKMNDDFKFCSEFHRDQFGHTTLTYSDVLQGGLTKKQILLSKWKTLNKLDGLINFNKYAVDELTVLKKLKTKLAPDDFTKLVNWYSQSKWHKDTEYRNHYISQQYAWDWRMIYFEFTFRKALKNQTFFDICGYNCTEPEQLEVMRSNNIFNDYLVLYKSVYPRKKLHIGFTSFKRLREAEQELLKIKERDRYANLRKKPFYTNKKWDKLKENIAKSDLNIEILNSVDKLVEEGEMQHNCIGDLYVEPSFKNACVILRYIDDKGEHYSIEINYDNKNKRYLVKQCFLAFNELGDEDVPERIEKVLNN